MTLQRKVLSDGKEIDTTETFISFFIVLQHDNILKKSIVLGQNYCSYKHKAVHLDGLLYNHCE